MKNDNVLKRTLRKWGCKNILSAWAMCHCVTCEAPCEEEVFEHWHSGTVLRPQSNEESCILEQGELISSGLQSCVMSASYLHVKPMSLFSAMS